MQWNLLYVLEILSSSLVGSYLTIDVPDPTLLKVQNLFLEDETKGWPNTDGVLFKLSKHLLWLLLLPKVAMVFLWKNSRVLKHVKKTYSYLRLKDISKFPLLPERFVLFFIVAPKVPVDCDSLVAEPSCVFSPKGEEFLELLPTPPFVGSFVLSNIPGQKRKTF